MRIAVELKNYSFKYEQGCEYILKDCNFTLKYGEMCLVSGLSGEGKTTLLSAINGIIPHNRPGVPEGEVFIDGKNASGMSMHERARMVGSVLQNADSQIFHSRVRDELSFGCENLNLPPDDIRRRVAEISALMGLSPDSGTKTLSGGQKQRLVTGSTLSMGQKILLLDEPLANLDFEKSAHLLKILKELTLKGYAVLLVEHRLDMVLSYADRFLELQNGKLNERRRDELLYANIQKVTDICGCRSGGNAIMVIRNLEYHVRGREIICGISLTLRRGERVVILGENGCGKTTLLRLFAGLLRPTGGSIEHGLGTRMSSRSWYKKVGYIYQEPSYQLFMPTVEQELGYGSSGMWRDRCLREFSLAGLASRHPHSLSEGQKRRVSIAAVSAGTPELILLDEPTVGQDFENLENMVTVLNSMHAETGNTIVTVTHDYRCAEALADRVIWLKDGRIFREGGKCLAESYFNSNCVNR